MADCQMVTLDRLSEVERILEQPRSTAATSPTTEGLERSAARMLQVLSLLGEVGKDMHKHASTLAGREIDRSRTAPAASALAELVSELRSAQAAAFEVHLAVQDPSRRSRFVDAGNVAASDEAGDWVRARSRGEQG